MSYKELKSQKSKHSYYAFNVQGMVLSALRTLTNVSFQTSPSSGALCLSLLWKIYLQGQRPLTASWSSPFGWRDLMSGSNQPHLFSFNEQPLVLTLCFVVPSKKSASFLYGCPERSKGSW